MSEAEAAAAETSEPTPMEGADGEQKEPLNEVRWVARSERGLLKNDGLGLGLVWPACGVGGVGGGSRAAASRA